MTWLLLPPGSDCILSVLVHAPPDQLECLIAACEGLLKVPSDSGLLPFWVPSDLQSLFLSLNPTLFTFSLHFCPPRFILSVLTSPPSSLIESAAVKGHMFTAGVQRRGLLGQVQHRTFLLMRLCVGFDKVMGILDKGDKCGGCLNKYSSH